MPEPTASPESIAATRCSILIPAAGQSRRMAGQDKLLRRVDGLSQLRRVALFALATGAPVIVTLPPDAGERRQALTGLPVTIIEVPDATEGMAASFRAVGQRGLPGGVLVVPGDMPDITAVSITRLLSAHAKDPAALLRGSSAGQPGHPVLLPADLVPALRDLRGDRGAGSVVALHENRLRLIALPGQTAVRDLDTLAEWRDWEAQARPEPSPPALHPALADPLDAAWWSGQPAVLAVITAVHGPSYRSIGEVMCFLADGTQAGSLTNGCIEGDLAIHAARCMTSGHPARLRYGEGSPFFDIRLPCGGALEVGLYPAPDRQMLADIACLRRHRTAFSLTFGEDGGAALGPHCRSGWQDDRFALAMTPGLRLFIFGEGAEAAVLARLAHSMDFDHVLFSPAEATRSMASALGCSVRTWSPDDTDPALEADGRTAIVTLFHDHGSEQAILAQALTGPALYVGAQGSRRVAEARARSLRGMGLTEAQLGRLHAPIGLIPSTRDARSLAISVLSEVVAAAGDTGVERRDRT